MEHIQPINDFYAGSPYGRVWDPLMSATRKSILSQIPAGATIIDLACGTGHQLLTLAPHIERGVGIDISDKMLRYADGQREKMGIDSIRFELADATDLSRFPDRSFDVALMTLLLHEIHHTKRIKVLREMKRLAHTVIVADYGRFDWFGKIITYLVEFTLGIFHAHHFVSFRMNGGLPPLLQEAGLTVKNELIAFGNTISIFVCTASDQ